MKTRSFFLSACFIAFIGFTACNGNNRDNSNPDNIPHYTPANPNDSTNAVGGVMNTANGKDLFMQHCETCHGIHGDTRNNNAANLQLTTMDSLSIAKTVRNGKGTMPMFSSEALPDSNLSQIILYVRTLQKT